MAQATKTISPIHGSAPITASLASISSLHHTAPSRNLHDLIGSDWIRIGLYLCWPLAIIANIWTDARARGWQKSTKRSYLSLSRANAFSFVSNTCFFGKESTCFFRHSFQCSPDSGCFANSWLACDQLRVLHFFSYFSHILIDRGGSSYRTTSTSH